MQLPCIICGLGCRFNNGESTVAQLRDWQRQYPTRTDDDAVSWILSLDLGSLVRDQCLCRTCGRLLSDLEGYEALADGVRSQLLQRHKASQQNKTTTDGAPCDSELAGRPLRRSSRRSGTAAPPETVAPPAAAASVSDRQPPPRGVRPPSSTAPSGAVKVKVKVKTKPAGRHAPPADPGDGRRSRGGEGDGVGTQTEAELVLVRDGDASVELVDVGGEAVETERGSAAFDDSRRGDAVPSDGVAEDADADSDYAPSLDADDGETSDGLRDDDYRPPAAGRGLSLTCSHCQLEFKSRAGLAAHRRRAHHDTASANTCPVCGKTFKHRGSLITHRRMVHGRGERCQHCDAVFRDFIEYYRHLSDAHGVKSYVCEHCGAGFSRRVMLNKHLRKEERKIKREQLMERLRALQCSVCDFRPTLKTFCRASTVHSLIRDHEYRSHGLHGAVVTDAALAVDPGSGASATPPPDGASGVVAPAAGDEFVTLTGSGEVMAPVVPEQRLRCRDCGLVFGCRQALSKHKRLHVKQKTASAESTAVQCEYCGKEFTTSYLKTHQESVHKIADANLFITCQYCGRQYHKYQKHHYISHLQNKHLMNKRFVCTEAGCGRSFLHQRGLLRHVRAVHERSVTCGSCPERFGSLWKRDKHRAEVHGQYDFACSECGLKFFRRAELEIHTRRVHTLQLKYQCAVCSHRSEERRKLLNHEHSQHGLHAQPLPENNPAGQLGYPCPACSVVFGCGLVVKQHAWEAHQIKLNIYGKPKTPLSKRVASDAPPTSDAVSEVVQ